MIKKYEFKIPIYNWSINILTGISIEHKDEIINYLRDFKVEDPIIDEVIKTIETHKFNSGNNLWDEKIFKQIILFNEFSDLVSAFKNIEHEKRHSLDFIRDTHGLEYEGIAYLDGWYTKTLFEIGLIPDILRQFSNEVGDIIKLA